MKILAIRGCNLASLAGEFEIDLSRAPFADAGVFAIVGNTGAGKSTLLDALCVALFDRTPRLTNHSRVVVGRGDGDPCALGAQDARTLLRRGAGSGWAEVDFESGDARRYRARWSVRRARGQPTGALQDQQMSLLALESVPEGNEQVAGASIASAAGGGMIASAAGGGMIASAAGGGMIASAAGGGIASAAGGGMIASAATGGGSIIVERLGGTKTETLKAIGARLGLTFDQFRRSALLAQGEFAAFLRADGRDRSELLERVTGTEIYTRLGVAAHVKAALAEQRLRDGRTAAYAIAVLDDDARHAAESDYTLATEARGAARERLARAEAVARWRAEAEQRARALAIAEAEHAAAIATLTNAGADHAELALRTRAEKLRPTWDAAERLDRTLALAHRDALAAEAALHDAAGELATTTAQRTHLADAHAPIHAACRAIGVVEPRFLATDTHDDTLVARTASRASEADRPNRSTAEPSTSIAGALELGCAAREDAEWLVARADLAGVLGGARDLDERFAQHALVAGAIAAFDRMLAAHQSKRTQLAAARELTVSEHQVALAKLADEQRRVHAFQQRRGLSLDAARRHEDEARSRLVEIEQLVAIAAGARQAAAARTEIDRQLVEIADAADVDAAHRRAFAEGRAIAEAVRAERARVVDELARAAGYEHVRAELVTGEPCPLCGALEHPWRDRGALDGMLAAARASLREAEATLTGDSAAVAAIEMRDQHRTRERARLANHRATADASATGAFATWRDHLGGLGELVLEPDPSTPAAQTLAADREASAEQALESARDVRRQTEAAAKAAADAQAEVQLQQSRVDALATRLVDSSRAVADLEAVVERLRGERAGRVEQLAALATLLVERIAQIGRVHAGASSSSMATGRNARAWQELVRDLSAGRADAEDLQRARALVADLAGEWRRRYRSVVAASEVLVEALAAIDHATRECERRVAEMSARLATAATRRGELRAELTEASEQLEAERVESGFDADALRRLLFEEHGAARIEWLAERIAGLERAVERTRVVVLERAQFVAEHVAARPSLVGARPAFVAEHAAAGPSLVATDVDGTGSDFDLEELETQVRLADQAAARLEATLAADGDARARRAAALVVLVEIEANAEVDRVLGEVIGSHDGKLFRSFAQSLTLDALLAVANAHLDELAPRYQLERVPRHDLELQVIDRDLGCEIRSVQSLSGGESFLVSLALALGLSSMSASAMDVRVRTLLIDEGFGTLDPATLDGALSVLDALQATGRQVGVISHVPALVERVGAHIRVVQRGGGRSEVIVAAADS